ncbi:hypothetical protein [Nocardia wallacei]|nr:hypothetical protein [Nocardia wallacei]
MLPRGFDTIDASLRMADQLFGVQPGTDRPNAAEHGLRAETS